MAKKRRAACTRTDERCELCKHFAPVYNSCAYVLAKGGSYDECVCGEVSHYVCTLDRLQLCTPTGTCECFTPANA